MWETIRKSLIKGIHDFLKLRSYKKAEREWLIILGFKMC